MKAVLINGSPRDNGNTAVLLETVAKELVCEGIETKYIKVGGRNIHGCRACWSCVKLQNRKCVCNDDIFNEIIEDILTADAIILGTPSYYSGMTPELKCVIDRAGLVASANGKIFRHKIAAAVIAQRRGGGSAVQADIHRMFLMNEMIIPGSTYWNFGIGRDKGEVSDDREAIDNMKNLASNIAWLLKKTKA